MLPNNSADGATLAISSVAALMTNADKLLVEFLITSKPATAVTCAELASDLADRLCATQVDVKFIEVLLAGALGSINNVC